MVGSFLARAVVDEVLAPAFLSNRNNTHPGDGVVEKAVGLLSREHCTARLEKVWGPGDGRPVSELKDIMDQLLKVGRLLLKCTVVKDLISPSSI
jgi:programmed cell death protein 4